MHFIIGLFLLCVILAVPALRLAALALLFVGVIMVGLVINPVMVASVAETIISLVGIALFLVLLGVFFGWINPVLTGKKNPPKTLLDPNGHSPEYNRLMVRAKELGLD